MPQNDPKHNPTFRGLTVRRIGWRTMPVVEDRQGNRMIAWDRVPFGKTVGYQTVEKMEVGTHPFLTVRNDFEEA
jgi:hypothetical protein